MPITENGTIKYIIPSHIRSMITPEFCAQFLKELHIIFGVSVEDTDMDYFVYQGGTGGWAVAFATACRRLGLDELYRYYTELEWFDSDVFDGELEDILVEYKLILGGFLADEIARQNGLNADDVVCCERCGDHYLQNDVEIERVLEDGDEEGYDICTCKTCLRKEQVKPLALDVNRMIREVLQREEYDFFVCSMCGKTHYKAHAGERYCLYCEQAIESGHPHANNYYREMLKEQDSYRDKIFGKRSD